MGTFIFGLILGILLPYIFSFLDIWSQSIANSHTLETTKIQAQIDKINKEEKQPCIGFIQDSEEEYKEDFED